MSDLPRLLLCSFDVIPGPSGSSRRLTEYLKALTGRFSVVVLSLEAPDQPPFENYQGARLLRVPVGTGDFASRVQLFARAVRRQVETEAYALAHFTDPFGGHALCELKESHGFRLLYEAQGFPSLELRSLHPRLEEEREFLSGLQRQELFCLTNADRVITGSATTSSFICSLGVPPEAVQVVRAPVDLGAYAPEPLGVPDGSPMRLLYLGSQAGWQGLPGLLRGLAVAVRHAPLHLTLVGASHPDWHPLLEGLIAELGLRQHVTLHPPVAHDDVAKVLARADVGVLPLEEVERNRLQGGPLAKVSDYLAAGRPILAADLPIAHELIPASAAVFYPPGDAQALAERLIELARDVPQRVMLGQQARFFAELLVDASLIRKQLLDIYDGLLGARDAGASSEPPPLPPRAARRDTSLLRTTPEVRREAPLAPERPPLPVSPPEPAEAPRAAPPLPLAPSLAVENVDDEVEELAELEADELEELHDEVEEVQEVQEEPPVLLASLPAPQEEPSGGTPEEPEPSAFASREPPASWLDPWFAQLAHGYCPPEGTRSSRPPPPTTIPGRNEVPTPPALPSSPPVQGATEGKPS